MSWTVPADIEVVEAARKALGWYGEKSPWKYPDTWPCPAQIDSGKRARKAIKEMDGEK